MELPSINSLSKLLPTVKFQVCHHVWNAHALTIILDGYNPDTGQRIHVVKENIVTRIINNALVISDKTYKEAISG